MRIFFKKLSKLLHFTVSLTKLEVMVWWSIPMSIRSNHSSSYEITSTGLTRTLTYPCEINGYCMLTSTKFGHHRSKPTVLIAIIHYQFMSRFVGNLLTFCLSDYGIQTAVKIHVLAKTKWAVKITSSCSDSCINIDVWLRTVRSIFLPWFINWHFIQLSLEVVICSRIIN